MQSSRRGVQRAEFAAIASRLGALTTSAGDERPSDVGGSPVRPANGARLFDPGRRGVVVLGVVALLAALGGAWYFGTSKPSAIAETGASSAAATRASPSLDAAFASGWPTPTPAGPPSAGASISPAPLVVDVVGKVVAPGVVTLSPGARLHDAIDAAGGALPGTDLAPLDLASKLVDGEEIFVGVPPPSGGSVAGGVVLGAAGDPGGSGASGAAAVGAPVDLNTATEAQLETLPGIGPVLAHNIVAWRTQHGRFANPTQLQEVSGIGPAKYAALASRVRA